MTLLFLVLVLTVLACICACVFALAWHLGHRNGSQGAVSFNEHLYRKRMEFETAEIGKREQIQADAMKQKLRASLDYERMSAAIKNGQPPSEAELAKLGDPNQPQGKVVMMLPCQEPPTKPA